ncbi:MAG: hypothetical protein SFU56_01825 [Capsulimonadales bacterium]|nr:hypothetical protein [Capsulimonadales bacterium]
MSATMDVNDMETRFRNWRGTAGELADVLTRLLSESSSTPEPPPTERLIRFYVTQGVLTRPDREGREARFGYRQLVETLATRLLLADGWSLARIADYLRDTETATLQTLLPRTVPPGDTDPGRTKAEALVRQFSERYQTAAPAVPPAVIAPAESVRDRAETRQEIRTALHRLGLSGDMPERTTDTLYTVAPWCQIRLFADSLDEALRQASGAAERERMVEDAVRVFRAALAEEIARRGKRR